MNAGTIRGAVLVVLWCAMACGGSQTSPDTASAGASASAGAPGTTPAGGGGDTSGPPASSAGLTFKTATAGKTATPDAPPAADGSPKERPFANTPLEAQSIIQEVIDAHIKPLWQCVADYRAKKHDLHKAVAVDVGIDQEGNLLGITSPNAKNPGIDAATRECMMVVLRGLPFPRSHAGVITVRQTFSDVSVQP